jgi:choline dehydrogenase-like flavoprotein
MKSDKYDLIVVGTGFASTFFLYKYLQKASPLAKVLVLERGFLFPHVERVKERRGEKTESSKLNENYEHTFQNNTPKKAWRFQTGFGGSSNCWYGCTPRFMPNDFRLKSAYGIAQDWPVSYDELEEYYSEVEELMSISGPEDTPFPKSRKYPQPPHLFTPFDKILKQQYGPLYINQPTARARFAAKGRNACCASTTCVVCPVNAKFTIENSQMGVYEDQRVELLYDAQVFALDIENKVVKSVIFQQNKEEKKVVGEIIALGANPIFNSNILLNSKDAHPLTGKGIGEQVGISVDVYLDGVNTLGGSTWVNANGYMLYDGEHRKNYAACLIESSNFPFFRMESGKWRNMANLRLAFEDLPDNTNQVSLTENKFKPQISHAGTSTYVQKAIESLDKKLPQLLSALPVEKIDIHKEVFPTEAHILGTARMSNHASEGVVDKHLVHHLYRNLFVLGGSSFTTYSPANPTLTISALSLYGADKSF